MDPTAAQRCGGVQLRRMSPTEFERWSSASLDTYAGDLVRAGGGTHDEVRQRARDLFAELMPEGLDTPRTWLMRVLEDGVDVGVLWLGPNPQRPGVVHVFEITIDAEHRGRGWGRRPCWPPRTWCVRRDWPRSASTSSGSTMSLAGFTTLWATGLCPPR